MEGLHVVLEDMVRLQGDERSPAARQRALAITAVEDAILRLGAAEGASWTRPQGVSHG